MIHPFLLDANLPSKFYILAGTDLQGRVFVRGSVPQYLLCLIISCFLQISFIVLARQGIKVNRNRINSDQYSPLRDKHQSQGIEKSKLLIAGMVYPHPGKGISYQGYFY